MTRADNSSSAQSPRATRFVVVGIGADGWRGLGETARGELRGAEVVYGSRRQLNLLERIEGDMRSWHSPMSTHLQKVLTDNEFGVVHILASGDPMFHGVGATIVRTVGAHLVTIIPFVSSASLACARLGWDLTDTRVVSAVTADADIVAPELTEGRNLLVLSRDESTPAHVAAILDRHGFGWSRIEVLEALGGPDERITGGLAHSWEHDEHHTPDPLNIVAISCVGPRRSRVPGRPDDDFDHDGQITKSMIRALTVSALRPVGEQVLWDIGSGSGSIAIEWLLADTGGSAIAFERNTERAARITANASRHGVDGRLSVQGPAPENLGSAPVPDAVFIGGGLDESVLAAAWAALRSGGRLVANAVTVESQTLLAQWHQREGGTLRRIGIETAEPLGSMTTWRPALPIVQWSVDKPGSSRWAWATIDPDGSIDVLDGG